ncbi:CopD family protein [Rhodoblastus sp. 17X3]|uniref:CopD family protein n=1 Tax=Rhodoblastus sp. 17X3 TaxID=3047026 RepID=UPI0024B6D6DA|nr:CopD family protein [Rhodoblastus sp. 17X3]MDI9850069.1 CopD family protein [Rhodoblastus sp. 17X3]
MSDEIFPIVVTARWAQFIALFMLFGQFLYPFYTVGGVRPPRSERLASSTRKTVATAGWVQALSILAWVMASVANMGDGWGSLVDPEFLKAFFFETGFGHLWLARLLMTAMLLGLVVGMRKRLAAADASTAVALFLVGALLASQAGVGHPAAFPEGERPLVIIGYGLHILGAAAWIGGFWPLRALLAEMTIDNRIRPYLQFVLRRYAIMASIAVVLVLLGAAINIRPQVGLIDPGSISAWGWAVGLKFILFGALIAIAYRNRFVLTPLLVTRPADASKNLLRNIVMDQGLALAVLAVASVMGIVSPSG